MESIIQALSEYFSPKFKEKLKRCETLEILIKKLKKKERCLNESLQTELAETEREKLMTKLAVLKVQKEKAKALLKASQEDE